MDIKEIKDQAIRDTKTGFILDAARKVFADKGYHESRLEDIASAAGFSKAALYNYYPDKESIFLSLAVRDFDELILVMRKDVSGDAPFCQNLERVLKSVFNFFGVHFAFLLALANFRTTEMPVPGPKMSEHDKNLISKFKEKFGEILEVFTGVFSIARSRREISPDIDDKSLANYLSSLVRGVVFEWKLAGRQGDLDAEVKRLIEFTCHGAGAKTNQQ